MTSTSILLRIALPFTLLVASTANAGDAIDTRVAFTFADDDILKGPEESVTGSPSIPNSLPSADNRLFFDDYEKRDTGFENLTHLALYAHQPGFFEGLDTEAALVLRAEVRDEGDVRLRDDGSYLKLTQQISDMQLALTAFPVSADRFRLGYSYDISWGGSSIFKNSKAAPGVRVDLKTESIGAFIGAKTGLGQVTKEDGNVEVDTVWGVLGGAAIDVVDELRMEWGAGYFYRGTIDKNELRVLQEGRFKTAQWQGFGGSMQFVYHIGMPIGVPIDFRLYKNDPLQREVFFKEETYGKGISFLVQSEFSVLGQTLQDPEFPKTTTVQWGAAGDVTARLKIGKARLHALAVYRDLAFILFNVPSLSPFVDLPDAITAEPELFASAGCDYYLEDARLTPGLTLGIQRPAKVTGATNADASAAQILGQQTLVVRSPTDFQPMNPGDDVAVIFAAKLTTRWDLSEVIAAIGEFQVSHDPNRRRLVQDLYGITTYGDEDPMILGFNIMLRARF